MTKKKSAFGKLHLNDLVKGLIVAVIGALVTGLYNALQGGTIEFTWLFFKPIVLASVVAGLSYIIKNWLTNSEDKFLKAD